MAPPVLQPATLRAWQVLTWVLVGGAGFQMVFRTDYGDREHVFSPAQRWYTRQVDAWMGIDEGTVLRQKLQRQQQQKEAQGAGPEQTGGPPAKREEEGRKK